VRVYPPSAPARQGSTSARAVPRDTRGRDVESGHLSRSGTRTLLVGSWSQNMLPHMVTYGKNRSRSSRWANGVTLPGERQEGGLCRRLTMWRRIGLRWRIGCFCQRGPRQATSDASAGDGRPLRAAAALARGASARGLCAGRMLDCPA